MRSSVPQVGLLLAALAAIVGDVPAAPVLTNAFQVRSLAPETASNSLPVQVTAIVTFVDPGRTVFIQDATGGTFIRGTSVGRVSVRVGDRISVRGVSYPGLYVPGISAEQIDLHGRTNLPAPRRVDFDALASGRLNYEWVEIQGTVHASTNTSTNYATTTVSLGQRKLSVHIHDPAALTNPPPVGARIRVRGLAAGFINDKRQLVAPHLRTGSLKNVFLEQAPLPDPFSLPLTPASRLLWFDPRAESPPRVKVRGVVTHRPTARDLFIRDGEQGLFLQTDEGPNVQPGDLIEAVGFPAIATFSAFLENAAFRRIGATNSPPPIVADIATALAGSLDANLIQLEGELVKVLTGETDVVLLMQQEEDVFHARMTSEDWSQLPAIRLGARLQLTGICRVSESRFLGRGFRTDPRMIELLPRGARDIAVLRTPPWWTPERLAMALGLAAVLIVIAVGWGLLLRGRVAAQTEVIRHTIEREAATEERHRLAREMHDSLAQSFNGMGFQLDALARMIPEADQRARQSLENARAIARHGQEEFRRSLTDLRSQELERGGVMEGLAAIGVRLTTGSSTTFECEDVSEPLELSDEVQQQLLRIGQEAINNAVRHAQAKRIRLGLVRTKEAVQLTIEDDGKGFDTTRSPRSDHFGLRGMKERAAQVNGQLDISSESNQGTIVRISVPL